MTHICQASRESEKAITKWTWAGREQEYKNPQGGCHLRHLSTRKRLSRRAISDASEKKSLGCTDEEASWTKI